MNKSLEALERIETVFHCNKQGKKSCYAHFMSPSKAIEEYYKDYNIIKQDLECKEQLEKENQELKSKLSTIEFWNERYIEHNDKLKKVLEIFKRAFVADLFKETLLIIWKANLVEITEEEHNLLKEILGD